MFLLTDYGTADELVGVVRAVLAREAPGAPLVDLTHDVPALDVRAGALALCRAAPYLGPGVVLGVVDPAVGTTRRSLAVTGPWGAGPRAMVGPDNGLLVWAAEALGGVTEAVALAPSGGDATTFDGRDVFAPAAAALWWGRAPATLGTPVAASSMVRLPDPHLAVSVGAIEAEVLWVDRFGNAQLAATAADAVAAGLFPSAAADLVVGNRVLRVERVRAFADLPADGTPGLLVDANGHLALACDRVPAATVLGVQVGEVVILRAGGAT